MHSKADFIGINLKMQKQGRYLMFDTKVKYWH